MLLARAAKERAAKPMTLAEWGDLDEDVEGELVDGFLEDEEVPTHRHELVVAFLLLVLADWARTRRGRATASETKLAVGPKRGRKPDVNVFLPPDLPHPDDVVARVRPHLVVEVVTPRPRDARRDRIDKLRDYAVAGAKHYWIVDPQVHTVEMFRLERGRYTVSGAYAAGRAQRLPGFPGLVLSIDQLWDEADGNASGVRPRPKRRQ